MRCSRLASPLDQDARHKGAGPRASLALGMQGGSAAGRDGEPEGGEGRETIERLSCGLQDVVQARGESRWIPCAGW